LFLPLSLDELSRGVATVIPHFDRSGGVTVGSHQINLNGAKYDSNVQYSSCCHIYNCSSSIHFFIQAKKNNSAGIKNLCLKSIHDVYISENSIFIF
jgi:hypothetical protein